MRTSRVDASRERGGSSPTTLTPQRKHRKLLKDGSSEVWPEEIERIFVQGLRDYLESPWATYSRGRSRWRNQFLVEYLQRAGIDRSKKQVASHIQVLRNMWKGEQEYHLVAGGKQLFLDTGLLAPVETKESSDSHLLASMCLDNHLLASDSSGGSVYRTSSSNVPRASPAIMGSNSPDSRQLAYTTLTTIHVYDTPPDILASIQPAQLLHRVRNHPCIYLIHVLIFPCRPVLLQIRPSLIQSMYVIPSFCSSTSLNECY
ncbi:hypothetical protein EDB19DRAFT_1638689 [Suillus lakei]|nr:hypothetical protein EDB19DRAFT_1638689 [Suillus lakei]